MVQPNLTKTPALKANSKNSQNYPSNLSIIAKIVVLAIQNNEEKNVIVNANAMGYFSIKTGKK